MILLVMVFLVLVFLLTGLWHGASWTVVIWGLFHGAFIVLERQRPVGDLLARLPAAAQQAYLLLVVITAWVFFRMESLPEALSMLRNMFSWRGVTAQTSVLAHPLFYLDGWTGLITLIALVWALMPDKVGPAIAGRLGAEGGLRREAALSAGALALLLPALAAVVAGGYTAFIYFRF